LKELQTSVTNAKAKGITPKALVIINPGNPTGQALNVENMKEVIFGIILISFGN
jgi:aspartate/methionine/tyrosine aminotransferase